MPHQPPTPRDSGRERRRWARAASDLSITIVGASGVAQARARDLSRAGVCFFLDRPIPLMSVLDVTLDLGGANGARVVRGHGAVVRCERIAKGVEHWEVAVFLHEMAESDRRTLEKYVAARPAL